MLSNRDPSADRDKVDGTRTEPVRVRVRAARMVPFVVAVAATYPLTYVGPGLSDTHVRTVTCAYGLFALTALLAVLVPWWRYPPVTRLVCVVTFCAAVGLLRDAGGVQSWGFGYLLLLPLVWLAVYGRRIDVVIAVFLTTVTLAAPIVAIGPPRYPDTDWRGVAMSALTLALTGVVVNRLVTRVTRQERLFSTVVDVSRRLAIADVSGSIVPAIAAATDAEVVTYAEVTDATHVQVAGAAPVLVEDLAPGFRSAVRDAKVTMSAGGAVAPGPWCSLEDVLTVLHQPVVLDGEVVAVISMGWTRSIPHLDEEVGQVVEMLAAEAAVAAERQRLVRRLEQLAHRDQLTGALNRRAWDVALAREFSRARRTSQPATIVLLDLDNFKAYNDAHGHIAGDELLIQATEAWQRELRDIDVLARWGGEEFVLLLPATTVDQAVVVVDRLRSLTPDGQTFSAGLVALEGISAGPLLRAADAALYQAKAEGRARNAIGHIGSDLPVAQTVR